jgi:hypothetical protein
MSIRSFMLSSKHRKVVTSRDELPIQTPVVVVTTDTHHHNRTHAYPDPTSNTVAIPVNAPGPRKRPGCWRALSLLFARNLVGNHVHLRLVGRHHDLASLAGENRSQLGPTLMARSVEGLARSSLTSGANELEVGESIHLPDGSRVKGARGRMH